MYKRMYLDCPSTAQAFVEAGKKSWSANSVQVTEYWLKGTLRPSTLRPCLSCRHTHRLINDCMSYRHTHRLINRSDEKDRRKEHTYLHEQNVDEQQFSTLLRENHFTVRSAAVVYSRGVWSWCRRAVRLWVG